MQPLREMRGYFNLIVWSDARGEMVGFQLCYDKTGRERALTWSPETGYSHSRVDDGESHPMQMKRTPIMFPDPVFDKDRTRELFLQARGVGTPRPWWRFWD